MRIISGTITGASRLTRVKVELSRKARHRLKWFDYYNSHNHNARLTCRHFDISPQTFYRWQRRYNPRNIASLEDRSHRPKHVRQPTYSVELVEAVLRLREEYPRRGKDKLVVLLHREGFDCSSVYGGQDTAQVKGAWCTKRANTKPHISQKAAEKAPLCSKKAQGICS